MCCVQFNPRAGFLDFLFVFAAVVIIANLFTSIVFQVSLLKLTMFQGRPIKQG